MIATLLLVLTTRTIYSSAETAKIGEMQEQLNDLEMTVGAMKEVLEHYHSDGERKKDTATNKKPQNSHHTIVFIHQPAPHKIVKVIQPTPQIVVKYIPSPPKTEVKHVQPPPRRGVNVGRPDTRTPGRIVPLNRPIMRTPQARIFPHYKVRAPQVRVPLSSSSCQAGWSYFDRNCYVVLRKRNLDWDGSRRLCQSMGGDLVSIHSMAEDKFITDLARHRDGKKYVVDADSFIGLRSDRNGPHFNWRWSDGTPRNFENWQPAGIKNYNDEKCAQLLHQSPYIPDSYKWNNVHCDRRVHDVMCKKRA